jgi:LmbE family N-acetylglucosaminyl deacetylase
MADEKFVEKLHPDHAECPFVTKVTCASRTRASKWMLGILYSVLAVFLGLVIYSSGQVTHANTQYMEVNKVVSDYQQEVHDKVQDVESSFNTYRAEKTATDRAVIEKLDEVKRELSEQRKEQRVLLEKILELQIEVARKQDGN